MDVTLVKEIIQEAIEKNLYEKDICFNKNINLNTYRYFKTKLAKPKKDDNIFIVYTLDKNARELFQYFYNLPGRKLNRKWSKDIFDHCVNYKKYENLEKYKQILNLDLQNKTKKEICSILNISLSLLYFYQNRETYIKMKNKKLNLESEQADKGIVDIEEEQSGDIV